MEREENKWRKRRRELHPSATMSLIIVRRKNIHHSATLFASLLIAALGRDLILGIRFVLLANNPRCVVRREL